MDQDKISKVCQNSACVALFTQQSVYLRNTNPIDRLDINLQDFDVLSEQTSTSLNNAACSNIGTRGDFISVTASRPDDRPPGVDDGNKRKEINLHGNVPLKIIVTSRRVWAYDTPIHWYIDSLT
jgi:hypothetical protein